MAKVENQESLPLNDDESSKIVKVKDSYYWTFEENKLYHEFLRTHYGIFDIPLSERKILKVNVLMSLEIKTRNAQQCHSHHQKMMKKYKSIDNLLLNMEFKCRRKQKKEGKKKREVEENVLV